jgi:drug/metabolite transporter (DMT)-like permease
MEHLEIILPITLLVLAFGLKLAIDRNVEVPTLIQALCELPVDMIFLSISFLIAFTISKPADPSEGLFFTIAFIVVAVLVVILWRKSLKLFDKKNKFWILLLCLNLAISTFSLIQSTSVLLTSEDEKPKDNIELNTEEDGN